MLIFEHPDVPAITDGEESQENQENNEAVENSSSIAFSNDSPETVVIEDNDDSAAEASSVEADAATNSIAEVGTAGEQRDVNPAVGEEAEQRQSWEEPWDFESDSGCAESSSAKESDDDNPLPGPSSKWTPRDKQSMISNQSASTEDSEEESQSSLPWKRNRNAEESVECPHDSNEDGNDSGDELLPGPSRKLRRDGAEREQVERENSGN